MMLYKLLATRVSDQDEVDVVSLTDVGVVGERIRELGIEVTALGMRRGRFDPRALWRLTRRLRRARPDLVQTWMYHADLLGGLAAKFAGRIPVIWGIRQSNPLAAHSKRSTIWTAQACAWLSRWVPARIVICSYSARANHKSVGYDAGRMEVIPNGFDTECFQLDRRLGQELRTTWGVGAEGRLVGLVGRLDPIKDHATFLRAAARLVRELPNVRFVCVGEGPAVYKRQLQALVVALGLSQYLTWAGARADMPAVYNALDGLVLSSIGEGFPNVVGEAMACGVPCVCTDVGDGAALVGDTGVVVPPGDSAALAEAVRGLLEEDESKRTARGTRARQKIVEGYGISDVARRYQSLYEEVLHIRRRGSGLAVR